MTRFVKALLAPLVIALCAMLFAPRADAQTYPVRTITFLVPATNGSSMDIMARQIAPILSKRFGQPIVVENRVGASGNIGVLQVARSAPDGYTVLVAANTISAAPWLYRNLQYDPVADFAPVAKLAVTKFALIVHPSVEAKRTSDFIALIKNNPGKLNYASPGIATPHHLAMELFKQTVGVDVIHIPYKGTAGALNDLIAGQVQCTFTPVHTVLPYVQAGKLRILGIASDKRVPWFPDIPTMAEEGINGVDSDGWAAFFVPVRTPADIVKRLSEETLAILAQADFRETALRQGVVVDPAGPEGLAELLKSDLAKWRKVVAQGKISGD
jgi:tripartite-type tricarboxylate transporter receptor subunit TctC